MSPIYTALIAFIMLAIPSAQAGIVLSKKTMTYDVFNRQTSSSLSKPDGNGGWIVEKSESNTYRGDKWHRASTTLISPITQPYTTNYLYDGDNVIADIVNGSVVKSYVTAVLDSNISLTDHSLSSTFYYNQDERQSVKNLTDGSGTVVQSYDYTAYGDPIDQLTNGTITQRYTYTGRELNEVSGGYYFRYRMYGAGLGGFLSRDPLGYVDGMSVYGGWFAHSLRNDPMGLTTIIIVPSDPSVNPGSGTGSSSDEDHSIDLESFIGNPANHKFVEPAAVNGNIAHMDAGLIDLMKKPQDDVVSCSRAWWASAGCDWELHFDWKPKGIILINKTKHSDLNSAKTPGSGVGGNPKKHKNYSTWDHEVHHANDFVSMWNDYMAPKLNAATNQLYDTECACRNAADVVFAQLKVAVAKEQVMMNELHAILAKAQSNPAHWRQQVTVRETRVKELEGKKCP